VRLSIWICIAFGVSLAAAQPATLTLRAKLRDFKDYSPTDPSTHSDFENDAYMDCGGAGLGYVKDAIRLDGLVDTALFAGDERNPDLQLLKSPTKTKPCFTSLEKFDDWYNDKPAINRSFYTEIVLTRNAQGLFVFDDDDFLPLNPGAGFGKFRPTDPDPFGPIVAINGTDVWGFTLELHTRFTYTAGKNQVFSFKGDDDVWVFINGRLAIDLGGLHPSLTSTIDLDARAAALGLTDGAAYPLDFFFAERHSTGSHCRITTSLQLVQKAPLPVPVATPAGQAFRDSVKVALTVPGVADAQIRYTTDGSEPTETSPLYAGGISIRATTTLKAKAFHEAYTPSPTLTEIYRFDPAQLPAPVADPRGREFPAELSVTLSVPGNPQAEIRVTLNGADPDSASPLYTGAIAIKSTTVLKAKAFRKGWLSSGVTTETYTLVVPPPPPPPPPPPNVVTLVMERQLSKPDVTPIAPANPILGRPIAVVSGGTGPGVCLACPPGGTEQATQDGKWPEWTATSRDAFRYAFWIYDNLGHSVVSQSGEVTQAMVEKSPADAAGNRAFRFRWLPVDGRGGAAGTGAYILKAQVVSVTSAAGAAPSEASFIKTFGYLRGR
jgi:fibro-slime domain-containing protein